MRVVGNRQQLIDLKSSQQQGVFYHCFPIDLMPGRSGGQMECQFG